MMDRSASTTRSSPLRRGADWVADREGLPTSVRAIFGYYAATGVFDYRVIRVKSSVDETIADIVDAAFETIEGRLAREFDVPAVEFEYETKLTLPAELTLGYLYRRLLGEAPPDLDPISPGEKSGKLGLLGRIFDNADSSGSDREPTPSNRELIERAERVEAITALVVEALIDGDMRDALNDEEFEDFVVDFEVDSTAEKRRIAEIAQRTLQESIEERLGAFPEAVDEAYRAAVEISEGHQDEDESFRALLDRENAAETIREEYKFAEFDSPPDMFGRDILGLPYFKTQYDRVGVIYDGMIDMYRAAGFSINDDFKRSIVLAIIGAQIWLDDVSDFVDDREEGQLTPVTAEYLLADSDAEAYENVLEMAETYLDYAKRFATDSGTPMTGIAVEYIYRDGEPRHLPR